MITYGVCRNNLIITSNRDAAEWLAMRSRCSDPRSAGPRRNVDPVGDATLAWIDWFNNRRLLEPLDDVPPGEFEAMCYPQQCQAMTA